ncbi:MAG: hypothetical protein U0031_12615 [Thermomicrobiales bacterium]
MLTTTPCYRRRAIIAMIAAACHKGIAGELPLGSRVPNPITGDPHGDSLLPACRLADLPARSG